MPKPSLWKNSNNTILPVAAGNAFPNYISPKLNVIVQLKFELKNYVTVQYVNHEDSFLSISFRIN